MNGKTAICKILILLGLFIFGCSTPEVKVIPKYVESVNQELIDLDPFEDEVCIPPTIDTIKEAKVDEVKELWNIFFAQGNAPLNDLRRKSFKTHAECVVEAVEYYQRYETDIGGSLPDDNLAHLVMGTIIALESSVDSTIISKSKLREIGLTQLHGTALAGFSREEVHSDPKLQIVLGTRWLAYQNEVCHSKDWVKLLSSYGAGKRNPTCRKLSFAKYRYHEVKAYEREIRK